MTRALGAAALAGLMALGGPACVAEAQSGPIGPGSRVPFVAQGPLLCGGASAAMVERFWGRAGVWADDYADLVSPEAGGIHTDALVGAMEERGLAVEVLRGEPGKAFERVRGGSPLMVLLESGRSRYHYVVVVAVGPEEVRVHDPLRRPGVELEREDFWRRWAAAGFWSAAARPGPEEGDGTAGEGSRGAAAAGEAPSRSRVGRDGSPDRPLPPQLQTALAHLRADRPRDASRAASRYLERAGPADPNRSLGAEMLATGRYLAGDLAGALAGWNLQGGPPVDLIEVRGLRRLHYRTVAGALGVEARDTLTPGIFRRARRRLGQLPGLARARLGYSVLRDGSVRLEAAVMEHPHWPAVPVAAIGLAASAALQERASLELGPFLPVGERWRLSGRWEAASSAGAVTVALPWRTFDAVATVRAGWRSEDLADGSSVERRSATLGLRRWITSWTRGGLTVGLERWRGAGRLGRVGVDGLVVTSEGAVRLGVAADGWFGPGARFGRVRAAAALRVPAGGGSRSWRTILGASVASPGAPPLVWDGAGTGQVRAPLLRGYTLVDGGRLGSGAMGRVLLHGTAAHAWSWRTGPASLAIAPFVDAAHVRHPVVGDGPRSYVSPGVEVSLSGGGRTAAVSLALGGDAWRLSGRVGGVALPWLSVR